MASKVDKLYGQQGFFCLFKWILSRENLEDQNIESFCVTREKAWVMGIPCVMYSSSCRCFVNI
jgi:hypothetical protein